MQKIDAKYRQGYKLIKRKIKTLERISLLTLFLLTHLIGSNNFLSTRLIKKTRTSKEIFGVMIEENKVVAKIFLQQVSKLLPKEKKKIFSILSSFFTKKKLLRQQIS